MISNSAALIFVMWINPDQQVIAAEKCSGTLHFLPT